MEKKRIIDELNEKRNKLSTILQNPEIIFDKAETVLEANLEEFIEKVRKFFLKEDWYGKQVLECNLFDYLSNDSNIDDLVKQMITDDISKYVMENEEIRRKIFEKYDGKLISNGAFSSSKFKVVIIKNLISRVKEEGLDISFLPYSSSTDNSLGRVVIVAKLSELPLDLEEIKYELTQYPDENAIKRLEPTKSI